MTHYRGAKLHSLSYYGPISKRIDQQFFQFRDLRQLYIIPTTITSTCHVSEVGALQDIKHLTHLYLNLRCFSPDSRVGDILSTLDSLTVLQLAGSWRMLNDACYGYTLSSVEDLELRVIFGGSPHLAICGSSIFSLVSSSFPGLDSLFIYTGFKDLEWKTHACFSDIQKLKNLPIRYLQLDSVCLALDSTECVELLKQWPNLKTLSIDTLPVKGAPDATTILECIPCHAPCLKYFCLPLEFKPTSLPQHQRIVSHSLTEFELCEGSKVPETLEGKLAVARGLIALFPRLNVSGQSTHSAGDDLAAMVRSNKDLLSAPPWTPDMS